MRHNRTTGTSLAVSAGLLAAAVAWAAPAQADPADTSFLSALDNAGISAGSPADTVALGQSVCPMLADSAPAIAPAASTVANAVSGITGKSGLSSQMAEMLIGIAVPIYCPQVVSSLAGGHLPDLPGLSGLSDLSGLSGGLPNLSGLAGLPGL